MSKVTDPRAKKLLPEEVRLRKSEKNVQNRFNSMGKDALNDLYHRIGVEVDVVEYTGLLKEIAADGEFVLKFKLRK